MKIQSDMIVTHLELLDDDTRSLDAGLVLATAEIVGGDCVTSVQFLTNPRDAWWVSRQVTVTVEWETSDDDEERYLNGVFELDRGFAAEQLDPDDFTPDSIDSATFFEGEE